MPNIRSARHLTLPAVLLFISACGGGGTSGPNPPPPPPPPPPIPVATVTVEPGAATIAPTQTIQLTATTKDASGNTLSGRAVAWSSSSTSVATVAENGLVTAVSPGVATITAASEGRSGAAQITVQAPVATVAVAPATVSILVAATSALTATLRDAANNLLTGRPIVWSTSNAAVATVSETGLVTAVAPGVATVTATSEGKSGNAQVTVLAPVASVTVAPGATTLLIGANGQLTATTRDAANNVLTGRTIVWSTGNAAVATVSEAGLVTAVAPGVATITATSEGKSGTAQVTVLAPVTSVIITGSSNTKVGDTYSYTATARIADGTAVVRPVSWSILETAKGSMTAGGILIPLQTGVITIVVTIDGVDWSATITAYDWLNLSSGGSIRVGLRADTPISNKFGTSERPLLLISCTADGYLFVYVSTDNFVTQNGLVAYNFDNGPIFTQTWDELPPSYSSLWHPGPTNVQRRTFAAVLALARRFGFAFTEFNASARAMLFRVTGLDLIVAPIINACPSNSLVASYDVLRQDLLELQGSAPGRAFAAAAESQLRDQVGSQPSSTPSLSGLRAAAVDSQVAVRRR